MCPASVIVARVVVTSRRPLVSLLLEVVAYVAVEQQLRKRSKWILCGSSFYVSCPGRSLHCLRHY